MFCDSISDRKFIVLHAGERAVALARAPAAGGFQKVVRKNCEVAAQRRAPQERYLVVSLGLENLLPVRHQALHPNLPSEL
jgi:hypothetical protein